MLVSACVWSERPLATAGTEPVSRSPTSSSWLPSPQALRSAVAAGRRTWRLPDDHRARDDNRRHRCRRARSDHGRARSVLTGVSSRANRARAGALSRHRWQSTCRPSLSCREPRSNCRRSSSSPTGPRSPSPARRRDRAERRGRPLRGGILVDVKRMNQIHEIDLADHTVTVGPASACSSSMRSSSSTASSSQTRRRRIRAP